MHSTQQNFTEKELKESYWIVTHAPIIRMWIIRMIVGIEAVIIAFFLFQFGWYGYFSLMRQSLIVEPLRAHAQYVFPPLALQEPAIVSKGVIDHGTGIIDLYAVVENSNQYWRADYDVIFSVQGVDQPPVSAFLYPGTKKYVFKLGIASAGVNPVDARITNVVWRRLSVSDIKKLNMIGSLAIGDFDIRSGRTESGAIILGTRATFTLEDKGVYDFTDFRVPVIITQGGTPVAATVVPVFSIKRNQKLSLEVRWDYIFSGREYDIVPDVDILDPLHAKPSL